VRGLGQARFGDGLDPTPDGDRAAIAAALEARRRGTDAVAVIRALWAVFRPGEPSAGPARLEQLRTAAARLERYAHFGAGDRVAAVQLAAELIARGEPGAHQHEYRSLAGVAAELDAIARRWRRDARARAGRVEPRRPPDGKPYLEPRPRGWEWPHY
jgi:hypothetical protein